MLFSNNYIVQKETGKKDLWNFNGRITDEWNFNEKKTRKLLLKRKIPFIFVATFLTPVTRSQALQK